MRRVDHRVCFLGVSSTEINDITVRRIIAQDRSASERSEKERLFFVGQRNGNDGCRSTDIADDGENIVFFNQLPHIGRGASRFVAIIERDEPQLSAVHAGPHCEQAENSSTRLTCPL